MKARVSGRTIVSLYGLIVMGIGVYFVFFRPALLPEDVRYIGETAAELHGRAPGLAAWLQKVFWVLGGYIFSTGLLTMYIAQTALRRRDPSAAIALLVAGMTSIAWMVVVNVILQSDFTWQLLGLALVWGAGLALDHRERRSSSAHASRSREEIHS